MSRRKIELTSTAQVKAVAALIAMGNGATLAAAAKHAGVTVARLRSWKRHAWWGRIRDAVDLAVPASERRKNRQLQAEIGLSSHLERGSLKAIELSLKYDGPYPDEKAETRLEELDMSEKSNEELARLAMPE